MTFVTVKTKVLTFSSFRIIGSLSPKTSPGFMLKSLKVCSNVSTHFFVQSRQSILTMTALIVLISTLANCSCNTFFPVDVSLNNAPLLNITGDPDTHCFSRRYTIFWYLPISYSSTHSGGSSSCGSLLPSIRIFLLFSSITISKKPAAIHTIPEIRKPAANTK